MPFIGEKRAMTKLLWMPVIAALTWVCGGQPASAGFFTCCRPPCCAPCYRVVNEIVYEDQVIDCERTVCETAYRDCRYTVSRPVYHTELVERRFTVCRPTYETVMRQCSHVVMRPVYETGERTERYVTCKPVKTFRTVHEDCGHWVCHPVCHPCVTCGPCGPVCGVRYSFHRVWQPRIVERRIPCVHYDYQVHHRQVPVKVCRLVPETVVREVPVRVCHLHHEQVIRQVPVTRCELVREEMVRRVPYTVVRHIPYKKHIRVARCVPHVVCDGYCP